MSSSKILIVGGHNAGKTHLGGQLYGRLSNRAGLFKLTSTPDDITIFKEVLDCLNRGLSATHTHSTMNKDISLDLQTEEGRAVSLSFPDYAGEQVRNIVLDRKVNSTWQYQINDATSLALLIRLDEIKPIEDITNRGLPELDEIKKRLETQKAPELSDPSFVVELLQMILFIKGLPQLQLIENLRMTIILSCWDQLDVKGRTPPKMFAEVLPLVNSFVSNLWPERNLTIIGLSSTERTLSGTEPDLEFAKRGPESFGYLILEDGKMERDLTKLISILIGSD